jgi:hypothetical protein
LSALILAVSAALAADPVVHDGDPGVAVARAAAASGRPAEALTAMAWDTLRQGPPALVGGGMVSGCAAAPTATNEQLQWLIQRADGAVAYGEADRAAPELVEARKTLGCLASPVDPDRLVRFWMLTGVVAAAQGDEKAAVGAFRAAIGSGKPGWDDAWPASARALFDRAAGEAAQAGKTKLTVVAPGATVHVDGKPVEGPLDVLPGSHVVLVGAATPVPLVIEVPEGAVQLVIPAAFPADLALADEASNRGPASALLAAALGEGSPAFVVTESKVWAASAGRTDWIALSSHEAPPAFRAGKLLAGAGLVVAVGGGVPAILGYTRASGGAADMEAAASEAEFLAARDDYEAGAAMLKPTRWVAAGGGALAVVGIGLAALNAPVPVRPVVTADGFGAAWSIRW